MECFLLSGRLLVLLISSFVNMTTENEITSSSNVENSFSSGDSQFHDTTESFVAPVVSSSSECNGTNSCRHFSRNLTTGLQNCYCDGVCEDCCNLTECHSSFDPLKCVHVGCNCRSLLVLNAGEFEYVDENAVSFNDLTLEVQLNTSRGLPVVCASLSQNEVPLHSYIAYIGDSLSILGCILVLITFCLFKELRTFPAKIIINIAIVILATNVLIILSVSGATKSLMLCDAVAIMLHFFMLAQFSWMTIMCFEMCRSFYHASRLIPFRMKSMRCKLVVYHILAWTVPLIIVVISVIVNYSTSSFVLYGSNPRWEEIICSIVDFLALIVCLLIPGGILVLLQLILFSAGIYFLVSSSKSKKSSSGEKSTPYLRVLLAMFFASNIMWVIAFAAFVSRVSWVWYPFLILFSIQGFVLFFGFYGTKRVLKLYTATCSKFYHSSTSLSNV